MIINLLVNSGLTDTQLLRQTLSDLAATASELAAYRQYDFIIHRFQV